MLINADQFEKRIQPVKLLRWPAWRNNLFKNSVYYFKRRIRFTCMV